MLNPSSSLCIVLFFLGMSERKWREGEKIRNNNKKVVINVFHSFSMYRHNSAEHLKQKAFTASRCTWRLQRRVGHG
jgi:hypothetical protein